MPFIYKISDCRCSNGKCGAYAFFFVILAMITFLSPETGRTARLAGEDVPRMQEVDAELVIRQSTGRPPA